MTSLLYIAIGYWAGRLRELRDPAHGLVPLAVGAAATAVAGLGMSLIQFLLGVDAPVSLLLLQQIFITVLVNTLIALPVYAFVRRVIDGFDSEVDVVLPEVGGFRQPLAAAYRSDLLATVEELIAAERMRPDFLFERCRVRRLDDQTMLKDRALAAE